MKYSFVIPCYNSEHTIRNVVNDIQDLMTGENEVEYEIILVNDCSKDNTLAVISSMAHNDSHIIAINLAKNVGQHGSIMAGLNKVKGEYVITLDDDGQTPIENLYLMMDKLREGFDVVSAKYTVRNTTSLLRKVGTFINRRMMDWLIESPEGIRVSVFLVMKRFVVDEIIKYKQSYPYISGLVLRTTHNIANVEMEQKKRSFGQSGYSFSGLLRLWLNGFTAFSIKPLRIATISGLSTAGIGVIYAIVTVVRKLFIDNIQTGWSSLVIIMLIIGGMVLFVLGIMGEYIGRIYMCINNNPQYVISEIVCKDDVY